MGTQFFGMGPLRPSRYMRLPHLSYYVNFGHSRTNYTSLISDILSTKFDFSHPAFQGHSRSLEPTHLSMTSYWCSITMTLYRSVSEIAGDICKTFPPLVYNAPLRGFPCNFVPVTRLGSKNRNDTPTSTTHILKIMFSGSGYFLLLCSPLQRPGSNPLLQM